MMASNLHQFVRLQNHDCFMRNYAKYILTTVELGMTLETYGT